MIRRPLCFLNLLWYLLINNNPFYERKYNIKQYDNIQKEKLLKQKTVDADLQEFKRMLMNHCIEVPPQQSAYFGSGEAKRILEYAKNGYFMHFSLYKYILLNKQKDEEVKITIYIDKPLPIKPLSQALFMGKEKHETKEDDDQEFVRNFN